MCFPQSKFAEIPLWAIFWQLIKPVYVISSCQSWDASYIERRKVPGFASLRYTIGLKNRATVLKPIITCSRMFSRAAWQQDLITFSFDWFTWFSASFVIGYSDYFGTQLHLSALMDQLELKE